MFQKGLTNREIAVRLRRPEAGVRNIRYRLRLKNKTNSQIKFLSEQRDVLNDQVSELIRKQSELSRSVQSLQSKKEMVEKFLGLSKFMMRSILVRALTELRGERPELFILNEQEQTAYLVGLLLNKIFS